MEGLNKVILVGRLGQDPKLTQDKTGNPFLKMSVATTKSWKSEDGRQEKKTAWHKVYVWGKAAEACSQYLNQGSAVMVEGHLSYFKMNTEENFNLCFISAERVNFLPNHKLKSDSEPSLATDSGLD